ncbi:MAG: hypothetical protein PWQ67_1766 [Clostridia bacterium]|jgi:hypothetical protein|nr:hypothetical protein [Clostridia bacterium]MDN5323312.1 hypothetical protein [Clostridia bacterium]
MNSQRILILGGLVLILIGIIYGFTHAGFFIKSLREARLESMQLAIDFAIRNQTSQAFGYLKQAEHIQELWERNMDAHSHVTLFGFQSLLLAFLLPYISLNQKLILILAIFMVMGGLLLPLGVVLEALGFEIPGFISAMLGGSWVLIATLGFTIGFLLHWRSSSKI